MRHDSLLVCWGLIVARPFIYFSLPQLAAVRQGKSSHPKRHRPFDFAQGTIPAIAP